MGASKLPHLDAGHTSPRKASDELRGPDARRPHGEPGIGGYRMIRMASQLTRNAILTFRIKDFIRKRTIIARL
ncbi:l-lysine 6-monooxygenase [Moniliophthora roreri]|nr:l-lysine 6-monooxygenase [Moniliophthora roreri]